MSSRAPTSQIWPHRCTPMFPVVRGVIRRSMLAGSIRCVSGSMSAKTGVISCHCNEWAVATNVNDGTMTSPLRPSARIAISSAISPLQVAMQCLTPAAEAMTSSNSWTYRPWFVSQRRSRTSFTRSSRRARSPRFGRPTWIGSGNAGAPPNTARSASDRLRVCDMANHFGRTPVDHDAIRHVVEHHGARADDGEGTDANALADHGAEPDPGAPADVHAAGQPRAARDVRAVGHHAVVVHAGRGVDDHLGADARARIDDPAGDDQR